MKQLHDFFKCGFLCIIFLMSLNLFGEKPRVSVIVLCDRAALLPELLADLFRQTNIEQAELLIVAPQQKIDEYRSYANGAQKLHMLFVGVEAKTGIPEQLNEVIDMAQGEFLIAVHGGDIHMPDMIEQMMVLLDGNPEIDLVYSDYCWSYLPIKSFADCSQKDITHLPEFCRSSFSNAVPGPVHMWRKSLHDRFGYFLTQFDHLGLWALWRKAVSQGAYFKKMGQVYYAHYFDSSVFKTNFALKINQLLDEERTIIASFPLDTLKCENEKLLVIIVPSYNNSQWYKQNLNSLFMQNYRNYRVIYIDDCSTDSTYDLVKNYISECEQDNRVTVIHNTQRKGCPLANIYHALMLCQPDEIAIIVDGDDWLAHENVFAHINRVYQDENVWLTYGQFAVFPFAIPGWAAQVPGKVIEENNFRSHDWCTTHLRTFYAGLFQKINVWDLWYNGEFFPMAGDLALMFPLLELAGNHSRYIPEILYIYNRANALNEDKINKKLQKSCEKQARNGRRYKPLDEI